MQTQRGRNRKLSFSSLPPTVDRPAGNTSNASPQPQLQPSNVRLVLNGIHLFCSICLLSAPYGLKDSGWLGLVIFGFFCGFAGYSAYLIRLCLEHKPNMRTYPAVGEAAFGITGRRFVTVTVFCLGYATSIESTIAVRDAMIHLFPKEALTIADHGITWGFFIAYLIVVLMLVVVCYIDIHHLDLWFTATGVFLSVIVVMGLFWVGLDQSVEYETGKTVLLNMSSLPMAIGFFAYCFAGHSYLPELYSSLSNRSQYMTLVLYIFASTMTLYLGASVMGYSLFGQEVESLFILSMPKGYPATYISLCSTIIHQAIRYLFGVNEMAKMLDQFWKWPKLLRIILVITTIPISLVVPVYGLLIAFLGSLLGTIVALIIPCACFLSIRRGRITRVEGIFATVILLIGVVSAIFGMQKSISEMLKEN